MFGLALFLIYETSKDNKYLRLKTYRMPILRESRHSVMACSLEVWSVPMLPAVTRMLIVMAKV